MTAVRIAAACAAMQLLLSGSAPAQHAAAITAARTDYEIRHWWQPVPAPPAGAQPLRQQLTEIVRRIAALPEFRAPVEERCYEIRAHYDEAEAPAPRPQRARVEVNGYAWLRTECNVRMRDGITGPQILINDASALTRGPARDDARGRFYMWSGPLPKAGIDRRAGFTIVTRVNARPVLLPVTEAEYVEWLIAEAEKPLRELEAAVAEHARLPKSDAHHKAVGDGLAAQRGQARGRVAELRAQLAALTPGERAAPACKPARKRDMFEGCHDPAITYVRINDQFFDPALPRTAIQLLVIRAAPSPEFGELPGRIAQGDLFTDLIK